MTVVDFGGKQNKKLKLLGFVGFVARKYPKLENNSTKCKMSATKFTDQGFEVTCDT